MYQMRGQRWHNLKEKTSWKLDVSNRLVVLRKKVDAIKKKLEIQTANVEDSMTKTM
jgi:hypothetical protein